MATPEHEMSPKLRSFNLLIDSYVEDFITVSRSFGEPLTSMAEMVKIAFLKSRELILYGLINPMPADSEFPDLMQPLLDTFSDIELLRDQNRQVGEFFNHLSVVSESVAALSWITVKPAPAQFIRDMREAAEYFGNRVLSKNKGSQVHTNWLNKWYEVIRCLEEYVRKYFLTGFTWGSEMEAPSTPAPHPSPPPPPPPPPSAEGHQEDRGALLRDLNQGLSIVNRLRHVGNRPFRPARDGPEPLGHSLPDNEHGDSIPSGSYRIRPFQAPAQAVAIPSLAAGRAAAPRREHTPVFKLEGRKWRVEHQTANWALQITPEDMSQSIAIFDCKDISLKAHNKVNGMVIDHCKRANIVLVDVIASVEIIHCDRVIIQCNGHVPLISINSSDSTQVFLTGAARGVEVITAKSTSSNICLLDDATGDYEEVPIPEQIRTVIVGDRLVSTAVGHAQD